jgi:hypothetical protein
MEESQQLTRVVIQQLLTVKTLYDVEEAASGYGTYLRI